jgi:hypothetical protein
LAGVRERLAGLWKKRFVLRKRLAGIRKLLAMLRKLWTAGC